MAVKKIDMFGFGKDIGFNMWYVDSPTPRAAKISKKTEKRKR